MDEELIETLTGSFIKTIYRSTNYMVSIFDTSDGPITVTGPSFDIDKESKYTLVGKYVNHPKYGFQFEMISISKYIPSAKEEIIKYLSSPMFKGIGKKAAEKVYAVLGDETLRIIKSDISVLNNINISDSQRQSIVDGMNSIEDDSKDSLFELINLGFTSKEANLIIKKFKEELPYVLKDNPFRFYIEVYGVSFKKVVECIKNLDFDNKEAKYKEALLIYAFKEVSFSLGDTYLYIEDFAHVYLKYADDFDNALNMCIENNYIVNEENRYYLKNDYDDEYRIADFFIRDLFDDLDIDEVNLNSIIKDKEKADAISYDDIQKEAIINFFHNDTSLIIGGPGTGKTTIIKALVEIFKDHFPYNNIIVLAPTGRAAKRVNEICNVQSKTIHSLLGWNKDDNTFIYDENNPIMYDAVIIDEFSMVDSSLLSSLVKASSKVKKFCFIGDDNQLPSIRQGNVLQDFIKSKVFPVTRLNVIHRQKKGNEIIDLASNIVINNVDIKSFISDVKFIDIDGFSKADLVDMINDDLNNFNTIDDIQVLSPMYRGEFGIDALNLWLQNSFNPKDNNKLEKRVGDCLYRENDKILQLKNRPDDDVYNGDIGNLEQIDLKEKTFLINYNGVYIYYNFDDLIDISLAYSLSVHKAQGSEYSIVYFFCCKQHSNMLYKKLIYTAISRAKTKLVIIGDKDTFMKSISKEERLRKTTLLERFLNYK